MFSREDSTVDPAPDFVDRFNYLGTVELDNGPLHPTAPRSDEGLWQATLTQYPHLATDQLFSQVFGWYSSINISSPELRIRMYISGPLQVAGYCLYGTKKPQHRFMFGETAVKAHPPSIYINYFIVPDKRSTIDRFTAVLSVRDKPEVEIWSCSTFSAWLEQLINTKGLFANKAWWKQYGLSMLANNG